MIPIDESEPPLEVPDLQPSSTILLMEDDENILNLLCAYLENAGHEVTTATKGDQGLLLALEHTFDLCVIDVMLPNKNGIDIASSMRESGCETPILFLTALGSESDILKGFGAGADDYMVKPFSPRVLLVRIEVILRRHRSKHLETNQKLTFGPIQLDEEQPNCRVNGELVELTRHEHRILKQLLRRPGRVFERNTLIASIYGNDNAVSPKSIDVHIHNLRCKLNDDNGEMIQTVRGFGYKLASDTEKTLTECST